MEHKHPHYTKECFQTTFSVGIMIFLVSLISFYQIQKAQALIRANKKEISCN